MTLMTLQEANLPKGRREFLSSKEEQRQEIRDSAARLLADNTHIHQIVQINKTFYRHHPKYGFRELNEEQLKSCIIEALKKASGAGKVRDQIYTNASDIAWVKQHLVSYATPKSLKEDHSDWNKYHRAHNMGKSNTFLNNLGFSNGRVTIEDSGNIKFTKITHGKGTVRTAFDPGVVPYDYKPVDQAPKALNDHLMWMFGGDEDMTKLTWEVLGWARYGHFHLQKVPVFIGKGGTGKGVLFRVIKKMFEHKPNAIIPFDSPSRLTSRFALQHSAKADIIMFEDVENTPMGGNSKSMYQTGVNKIKQMSGGDATSEDVKYGDQINVDWSRPIMMATNYQLDWMDTPENKEAWGRRFLVFPTCPKEGYTEIPQYENVIVEHDGIDNIICYALHAFAQAVGRDGTGSAKWTCSAASINKLEELSKRAGSSIEAFINDHMTFDEEAPYIYRNDLFDLYINFTGRNKALSHKEKLEFLNLLREKGFEEGRSRNGRTVKYAKIINGEEIGYASKKTRPTADIIDAFDV